MKAVVRELLGKRLGLSSPEISEVDDNKDLRAIRPEDEFWAQDGTLTFTSSKLAKVHGQETEQKKKKRGDDVARFISLMWPALYDCTPPISEGHLGCSGMLLVFTWQLPCSYLGRRFSSPASYKCLVCKAFTAKATEV